MGLYLRIRLSPRIPAKFPHPVEHVALVNSGYQAEREEIILSAEAARSLGWWPQIPDLAVPWRYGSASSSFEVYRLENAVGVSVVVPGGVREPVLADAVIAPSTHRILINDSLGSALGIAILDLRRGLWAFSDELDRVRDGEPPPSS